MLARIVWLLLGLVCALPSGLCFEQASSTDDMVQENDSGVNTTCNWPRGGKRCCGTLRTPGVAHGWRGDETDHCFPGNAADHMVCCVDIQSVDNEVNQDDPTVAYYNPLSGPIRRNSHSSSYSWCTCSETICTKQLRGRVAWVGKPGDT